MAVHEPQIGPPPPSWRGDHSALAAPRDAAGLLGVPESEMSALVAAAHWSDGPLGDPQRWPQSLRTAVGICLASRFPILLWWGPDLVMIYNDAYRPMLGQSKHPRALGAPGREVWAEIWDVIGPMLDQVMAGWRCHLVGTTSCSCSTATATPRSATSPSPTARSPTSRAGSVGVFCAVTETTERVVGERRLATLAEMAALMGAPSRADVVRTAATIMGANTADHPVVVVLDAPPEGAAAARWPTLVEQQLPELRPPGTRARVADLVRQVSGTGRAVDRAAPTARPWRAASARGTPTPWRRPPARRAGAEPPSSCSASRCTGAGTAPSRPTPPCAPPTSPPPSATCASSPRSVADAQALVELDAAKSAFFTNLSHELRTPLTLIAGPVQEALAVEDDPAQRERLELVERNTHRLARLVDAMLDFGRIEAGGLAPRSAAARRLASSPRAWPRASGRRSSVPGSPSATTAATASRRTSTATWSSGSCSTCCPTR